MTRRKVVTRIAIGVLVLAVLSLPLLLPDLTFFVQMVLAAVIVTGLGLFMGYTGQASLGQAAFVAVGALTVAVLTARFHVPPVVALLLAPVVAGGVAALVGWPLLRLRGHYLAFGTLAVLLLVNAVMATVPLFGAGMGIGGIPPLGIGTAVVRGQLFYAYLALGVLAVALLVGRNLVASRFGRGMRAIAGSESAAAASGVAVLRTKVVVFAIAGAYAGVAGGILAFFIPYVSQDSFPAALSFGFVIMAVIGGLGTLWGGVVGAVVVSVLLQVLNTIGNTPGLPATAGPVLQYVGYGVTLIVVLLFVPGGLARAGARFAKRIAARLRVEPSTG